MAGVLSFALGLETSAFSGALDRAGGRLLAFLSVGKAVEVAFHGVMDAIERGGALNDLSNRTGETVGTLYQLQEAFNVVGISADSLPGMINKFNKSLSGVGEMGESTTQAFGALGLSVDDLKKMDAPSQIGAVAEKLAMLDKGSATDIASRLFGREGAGNILQISRDMDSFRETIAQSSREAAVFARNAAAFDKLGDTVTRVKGSLSGMFAGVAEGIVPTLQGVADALQNIDLVAIGQNIGTMFAGAFQAFKEGKLGELISQTLVFGFEAAVALAPGIFAKLGTVLLNVFKTPLLYFQAGMEYLIQQVMEGIGQIPGIGSAAGLDGFKAQSFAEVLADRKETGLEFFTPGNTLDTMNQAANDSLAAGWDKTKSNWDELFGQFTDFASRGPQTAADVATKKIPQLEEATNTGKASKPDVTALEKMGFVFNGGSSNDPSKKTADNTGRLVTLANKTNEYLSKLGTGGQLVNI